MFICMYIYVTFFGKPTILSQLALREILILSIEATMVHHGSLVLECSQRRSDMITCAIYYMVISIYQDSR